MQSVPEKPRPASLRSKQWEWGLCLVLLTATMLNYANRQVLPISATRMMQELGLSNEEYGKIEAVFGLAFGTGALVGGCIADWIKIRWLYPSLMILWSMAGLMTGQANTFAAIWSCRLCLGLFEAGHWPCALRTTQRVFAPSRRPLANSILQSGAPLGAILPSLLMLIAVTDQEGSWRKIFWMVGILGLPWAIGWLLLVRTQDLQHPVLQTNESTSSGSAPIHEIPFHRILVSRRYWILIAVILCINTCWHYIRVWMPLALENNLGYSSDEVQQVMIGYWISTFMGSLFSGFLLNYLVAQGYSIHRARLTGFTGFSLLTSLGGGCCLPVSWTVVHMPDACHWICFAGTVPHLLFAKPGTFRQEPGESRRIFRIYHMGRALFFPSLDRTDHGSQSFFTALYFCFRGPVATCRFTYYLSFCGITATRANPCPLP